MKMAVKNFLLRPFTVYVLLALAILLPLLSPGYILTLDMVFTPHFTIPHHSDPHFLFLGLLHALNVLLPSDVIQKIVLLTIFITAGTSMHYLMARLRSIRIDSHSWKWACYFAGILYVCNPFVYSRFMSGQYLVLLAYALLPLIGTLALRLVASPQKKDIFLLGLALGGIGLSSLHMLLPALIVLIGAYSYGIKRPATDTSFQRPILYVLLALTTAVFINSFWLVPLIRGHGDTATTISSFTTGDITAFQTTNEPLGLLGNLLALQGFWGDIQNLYDTPDTVFSAWLMPIILLWLLVLGGIIWSWRNQRLAMLVFLVIGFLGMVCAVGTSGTVFAPINAWLTAHIPLAAGYREPQKFVALIVLAYAYFGGVSVAVLRQRKYFNSSYFIMVLPILTAPLLLFGGMWQLHTVDYPADWYAANRELSKVVKPDEKTLFLPWHLYMPYEFTGRVIANPAPKFFSIPIIASSNPELGGASPSLQDNTGKKVDQLLRFASRNENLAHDLASLNIEYIIISKDFDYKTYDYLQRKNGINLYKQMETLTVYRVSER